VSDPRIQPEALALEDDHLGVVDEPVDERGDRDRVTEDLGPGAERLVAGSGSGAAAAAGSHTSETGPPASAPSSEGTVASLISTRELH
jgi:hypothetical protein